MIETPFVHYANLIDQLPEIPADSIISRSLFDDGRTKVILFGFAPGQELSEHTAARPAILQFLSGEATLTLGDETMPATPGTWAYMQPHLSHSIVAKTAVVMLLLMLAPTD